jgi:hypothetical protein
MPRFLIAILTVAAFACGDNRHSTKDDAGPGSDATMTDAGSDGSTNPFAFCLDRPDKMVSTPPTQGLPCDLIPPAALH